MVHKGRVCCFGATQGGYRCETLPQAGGRVFLLCIVVGVWPVFYAPGKTLQSKTKAGFVAVLECALQRKSTRRGVPVDLGALANLVPAVAGRLLMPGRTVQNGDFPDVRALPAPRVVFPQKTKRCYFLDRTFHNCYLRKPACFCESNVCSRNELISRIIKNNICILSSLQKRIKACLYEADPLSTEAFSSSKSPKQSERTGKLHTHS